jgi:hypothetical protein
MLKKLAGFAQQAFANGCEMDGMRAALQQALPDFIFQRLDLPAQCGLRQKDFLRGGADVTGLGHGHEVTQLSEFHVRQHNQKAGSGKELGIIPNEKDQALCSHENESD